MKKQIDQIILINFKKHKDFKITVDGRHFLVAGMNGSGKTSVLDAVLRLLGRREETIKNPVTTDAEEGKIGIYIRDNGDRYYVEEKFKPGKPSSLKFYKVDGVLKDEQKPALTRLQEIVGPQADWASLIDLTGAEQLEFFKKNLGLDLTMYDVKYKNIFESRTIVNREVKAQRAKLESPELRIYAADREMYAEEKNFDTIAQKKINLEPLYDESRKIADHNGLVDRAIKRKAELEAEVRDLEAKLAEARKNVQVAGQWLIDNPKMNDEGIAAKIMEARDFNFSVDEELKSIVDHNKQVAKVKNYVRTEQEYLAKVDESNDFTKQLQNIKNELQEKIKSIAIGDVVEGLELVYEAAEDADGKMKVERVGLYMNDLPFHRNQLSYGKMLKAVIKLAAYFNHNKLNFIPINDWTLLDEEAQKEIIDFAHENKDLNIQLGIEKVDKNKEIITELIEA